MSWTSIFAPTGIARQCKKSKRLCAKLVIPFICQIRTEVEPELDRIAEERFKTIALVLTGDSEQTRIDLEELLSILSIRDDAPEVMIFQFERNELAALIDAKFIVDLAGLYNSKDRRVRVLAALERYARSVDAFEDELYSAPDLRLDDLSAEKTQASLKKKVVDPLEAALSAPSAANELAVRLKFA